MASLATIVEPTLWYLPIKAAELYSVLVYCALKNTPTYAPGKVMVERIKP